MKPQRKLRVDFLFPITCDPERKDEEGTVFARPDKETGFLHLDAIMTRVGVFDYQDAEGNEWGELREEEEVFDEASMKSFQLVPVTDDHPERFVDVKNVKDVQVGSVGSDVRKSDRFMRASVVITDAATILGIQSGKRQLSCGYTAVIVDEEGERDGKRFSAKQTEIRGNHLAIVDVGRAGPSCALLSRGDGAAFTQDSTAAPRFDETQAEESPMKMNAKTRKAIVDAASACRKADAKVKEIVDGLLKVMKADEAAELVEQLIGLLQKAMKSGEELLMKAALREVAAMADEPPPAAEEAPAEESPAEPSAEPEEEDELEEEELDSDDADAAPTGDSSAKLRAKVDALELKNKRLEAQRKQDKADEAARLDERAELVAVVKEIAPDFAYKGKRADELRRAVVLAVHPDLNEKLDANKKSSGYLLAQYEMAVADFAAREDKTDHVRRLAFDAHQSSEDDLDQLRTDFVKNLVERSRTVKKTA